jgi:hypothetical protein
VSDAGSTEAPGAEVPALPALERIRDGGSTESPEAEVPALPALERR